MLTSSFFFFKSIEEIHVTFCPMQHKLFCFEVFYIFQFFCFVENLSLYNLYFLTRSMLVQRMIFLLFLCWNVLGWFLCLMKFLNLRTNMFISSLLSDSLTSLTLNARLLFFLSPLKMLLGYHYLLKEYYCLSLCLLL